MKSGDIYLYVELKLEMTVVSIGRMVYLQSSNGLPFTVAVADFKAAIHRGEWIKKGMEGLQ